MERTTSFWRATFLLLFVSFCLYTDKLMAGSAAAGEQNNQAMARPVPTAEAILYLPDQSFCFPGKVKAGRRAKLSFQVAGQIEQLNILEGQQVKKGDVLSQLDRERFVHAVEAARAKFLAARQDFIRASTLYQEKVISKARFDSISSAWKIARAELDIQKKLLADSRLVAPFDGLVARRYAERKEHVAKGKPVLLLQDISGIEVEVQLPEQLVARGGREIIEQLRVRFDVCPDQTFEAAAMELGMKPSQDTRTYALVIKLSSPPDMKILPGMTASVTGRIKEPFKYGVKKNAVLVPVEAVAYTPDSRAYVWVVDRQTAHARKRMVSVGAMHGDSIEVLTGLKARELVAVAGLNSLDEKQRIRPMKAGRQGVEG